MTPRAVAGGVKYTAAPHPGDMNTSSMTGSGGLVARGWGQWAAARHGRQVWRIGHFWTFRAGLLWIRWSVPGQAEYHQETEALTRVDVAVSERARIGSDGAAGARCARHHAHRREEAGRRVGGRAPAVLPGELDGMVALLDCCQDHGVTKLVFSSSAATYGLPDVDLVDEDTPCLPLSPYGETKLIGEWLIRTAPQRGGWAPSACGTSTWRARRPRSWATPALVEGVRRPTAKASAGVRSKRSRWRRCAGWKSAPTVDQRRGDAQFEHSVPHPGGAREGLHRPRRQRCRCGAAYREHGR